MAEAQPVSVLDNVDDMTPDQLMSLARVAEAAERYPDMCLFMKKLVGKRVASKKPLAVEERNLLSVAYKNVVGSKRSSWRTLASGNFNDIKADLTEKYKIIVEKELSNICNEVLNLLTEGLLKNYKDNEADESADKNDETQVFYLKMCGDYYRYLAEFTSGGDDADANAELYKKNTQRYYSEAMEVAKKSLPETHPTRLGLALNFSVCYYEILKKPDEACQLAKEAFDAAIEKLDTLNDASYKDSTLIMQLLRDNLTLWTSEQPANDEANP